MSDAFNGAYKPDRCGKCLKRHESNEACYLPPPKPKRKKKRKCSPNTKTNGK